jgi:hypothetical protein
MEADCRTEPYRSDNVQRKSHKHNILSYNALLSNKDIRRKSFGDARVGVLNIFTHPRAMQSAMELQKELLGDKARFMLYNVWEAFGDYFRPAPPRPDLFYMEWPRVENSPFFIDRV